MVVGCVACVVVLALLLARSGVDVSLQRPTARLLAGRFGYGPSVPQAIVRDAATVATRLVSQSRLDREQVGSFALGDRSVSVAQSHFVD